MSVFAQLVGQPQAVEALSAAAAGGPSMSHAWLITGPPGSGRSVAARSFAAALQCTEAVHGCGQCASCREVLAGSHPDVVWLSTDKLIITIDEVKDLIHQAQLRPWRGRWRIIIIEDADRMAERTTNLLLKSIEEPPEHTVWLLCTPSAEDVLPTIRSRCRLLTLRIPPVEAVAQLLVERDGADPDLALRAAQASQCHIGVARYLASDPQAWERRRETVRMPLTLDSVGDAVLAANSLVEAATREGEQRAEEEHEAARAQLIQAFGLEGEQTIPPQLRGQFKELEGDKKRRARRAMTDIIDRALIDLLSFYRDVLTVQLEAPSPFINDDLREDIARVARSSSQEQTLARIEAVEDTRQRLMTTNVQALLALESLMVRLR